MCGCLSCGPHWEPACSPGIYPDWELNWQPFGLQPAPNPLSHSSWVYYFLILVTISFSFSLLSFPFLYRLFKVIILLIFQMFKNLMDIDDTEIYNASYYLFLYPKFKFKYYCHMIPPEYFSSK